MRALVVIVTEGRRAGLQTLLEALSSGLSESVGLLVVHDATVPDSSWWACAEACGASYVCTGSKGLSRARNAGIHAALDAGAEFLVFIDDDEVPEADWPEPLLAAALSYRADVAFGPVDALLPDVTPWWFTEPALARPPLRAPEGPFEGDVYTGNTALRMSFLREHGLLFRDEYSSLGGEDTDFFRRARAAGARVVFVPGARVDELVELDRLTFYGFTCRAYRGGRRYQHLLSKEPVRAQVRALLGQVAHLLVGVAKIGAGISRRRTSVWVSGVKECAFAVGAVVELVRGSAHRGIAR